jgi:hypothetical protein
MERNAPAVEYSDLNYSYPMELFTTVLLALAALVVGVGLVIYGIRGTRESQARDGRTYKRGRL